MLKFPLVPVKIFGSQFLRWGCLCHVLKKLRIQINSNQSINHVNAIDKKKKKSNKSLPVEASIQWHASEVQRSPHECLYQKLLISCKMNELLAFESQAGTGQGSLAHSAVEYQQPPQIKINKEKYNLLSAFSGCCIFLIIIIFSKEK